MKIRPFLTFALAVLVGLSAFVAPGVAAPSQHEEVVAEATATTKTATEAVGSEAADAAAAVTEAAATAAAATETAVAEVITPTATAPEADEEIPLATRAAKVLEEQLAEASDRRIPRVLRDEARCVGVFPSIIKAGFIVAARRGHGLVSCRDAETGAWGSPAVFTVSAASIGLQAGIQSASVILLFMNEESVDRIATGDKKLALGADINVTAGPVGGTATVDSQPAIVSYARTKGLFAGLNLEGTRMGFAPKINAEHYGQEMSASDILLGHLSSPESLAVFQTTLTSYAVGAEEIASTSGQ